MIKKISYAMLMASLAVVPLVFTSACAGGHGETTGQYASDKDITKHIKNTLNKDPLVKGSEVQVMSMRGNVQLAGFVENQAAKDRAGIIAQSTPGVVSIHNDLIVGAGAGMATPTGHY